jgi:hypothetical protein
MASKAGGVGLNLLLLNSRTLNGSNLPRSGGDDLVDVFGEGGDRGFDDLSHKRAIGVALDRFHDSLIDKALGDWLFKARR